MKIIGALAFVIISATANLEDLDDQTYYIQSSITKKYLYVDHTLNSSLNGMVTPRNVSILETANKIPTPIPDALFLVVKNSAIGPYYNIINLGTNSTLFATEILISYESGSPAYKVMALNNATLLNTPEAIWNIRTFLNDTYILNVHFGSYLYTNNALNSSAVTGDGSSLPLLLPSETAGRALGTQWLIVRSDVNVGAKIEDEGQLDRKDAGKMTEGRAANETKKGLEEHVDNQQGGMAEKFDKQWGNEEVVVEEKVVKTVSEQLGNRKAVEEDEAVKKEVEQMEIEPVVENMDLKKYEQVEMVPSAKIEKLDEEEDEQGGMESGVGEEKVEKNEDDQKEMPPWMTPMEPWLREEIFKKNKGVEQAQMDTGTEDEEKVVGVGGEREKIQTGHEDQEKVDWVQGEHLQIAPGMEVVEENRMRDETFERSAMLGWETRVRVGPTKARTSVDPNDPDFKAFALMFNCHTTHKPTTAAPWVIYWPYPYTSPYARPRRMEPRSSVSNIQL